MTVGGDLEVLQRQLPEIASRMDVFKQDYEDGAIKLILDELKAAGVTNFRKICHQSST